jgi:hypothetical protein
VILVVPIYSEQMNRSQIVVVDYAAPNDDMARLYVNDRIARSYCADTSSRLYNERVKLHGQQGWRFIFWNHQQCYGPVANGAASN